MLGFTKLFGSADERRLKKMRPTLERVNGLEEEYRGLTDRDLRSKTTDFKQRLASGDSLGAMLPEAFSAVREASLRTIGLRHFDVQLIGGLMLHEGKVAEMRTGEGKTLVATLPAYLNALEGNGVHIVTVNDYLAKRDVQWMGPIYHLLGMTVSSLYEDGAYQFDPEILTEDPLFRSLRPIDRKNAYECDITYGTNHDFGFDYLRDNMAVEDVQVVQRGNHFAIVDEVDYILIDEARTPLIISGPAQESNQTYGTTARLVPRLELEKDYTVEEKQRSVSLTLEGIAKVERLLNLSNLYDPQNSLLIHYLENALRAEVIYRKDKDYVVNRGQVIIVDEFTGRLMEGRRYGDGLHQAIEAKEGVRVQKETLTYATITLQNYFRMYSKLAGMTGTAVTEAEELGAIYGLEVAVIPTHQPMVRDDLSDYIYKTSSGKWKAIVREIHDRHSTGQPILVGTTSIENSEHLSTLLKRQGIAHQILNAKQHEREASIVADAGRLSALTVATNMAGRGTDIVLGGNPTTALEEALKRQGSSVVTAGPELLASVRQEIEAAWREEHNRVVELGGLFVVGTEKHEARRIDNQLRGRAGRQGDPGGSRFYAALDDDLMRRFGGERIKSIMDWAGLDEDQPIENRMVTRVIESSQSRVEGYHFELRKHLVQYDDVINTHREVIYGERRKVLQGADLRSNILTMFEREVDILFGIYMTDRELEEPNVDGLLGELRTWLTLPSALQLDSLEQIPIDEIRDTVVRHARDQYDLQETAIGSQEMRQVERLIMLRTIDAHWLVHLTAMENLRQGVGLHAYGQRDPLVVYRTQAHEKFQEIMANIQHDVVRMVFSATMNMDGRTSSGGRSLPRSARGQLGSTVPIKKVQYRQTAESSNRKVGRNDPCPCGSGRKYKRCHGVTV
jgi:preprotein translocase subunit SecA